MSATSQIKLEAYDRIFDWTQNQFYFDQLLELYGWKDERKAMFLGACLKEQAEMVLAECCSIAQVPCCYLREGG